MLHQDARLCNNVVQSKLSRPTAVWVQQKHNKRMRIAVDVDEGMPQGTNVVVRLLLQVHR